ncbi:MAG: PAS domain S-box protein [Proteobacteria bacterium]|nr:PAS domain S-box protein [Pseudomonadota bacterium]
MRTILGRLLLIVAVALAPGLLLQIAAEYQARRTRAHLMEDEVLRLVRLVSAEQQRIVDGAEQMLTTMGSGAFVVDHHPDLCERLLGNIMKASPRYNSAGILAPDGHALCMPPGYTMAAGKQDRPYFRRALASEALAVGDYAIGRVTGQPTLHLAKSFRNSAGALDGVAMVALNLDWLARQLAALPLPAGAAASVRDGTGLLLAQFPPDPTLIGKPALADEPAPAGGREVGIATIRWPDGRWRLTAFAAAAKGLQVAVGLDAETSFAAVTRANDRGLMLIGVAVSVALAATVLLSGRLIRRPVQQLLAAADRWRSGDLSARTGIHSDSNEFDRLATAFDAMAEAHQARDAALRDSEEEYRATFEQASVGMSQNALDGTLLRVNDALCAIHGSTREELLGRKFQDLTHPDDRHQDAVQVAALLAGAVPSVTAEKRYIRQDGRTVWVNRWGSLLRDRTGRPVRLITIIEDITERKATQRALQEVDTRLRLAQEAAGFGVWEWDLASTRALWSDDQWRIRGLLPRATNVDFDEWTSGIHPDDRDCVVAAFHEARLDANRPLDMTYRIVRPDNTIRWLLVKSSVVCNAQGVPERLVGLTMDVTEMRETEAQLRRLTTDLESRVQEEVKAREAAQLRAAHAERMQALGQLAGGIAHDFNNILQMVLSASTLLEEAPGDEALVSSLARLITEAAERGAATTSRLLTVGHHGLLRAETVDVAALLSRLREVFTRTLGSAITVELELADDLPCLVADKAQLETSLINLAANARDAMPKGGHLLIAGEAETIGYGSGDRPASLAAGAYVRLRVTDSGSGMDAATLAHVGRPFFTTKKAGAGTGLGLATVRSFVERSGGGMTIESTPGTGTSVTLWLPAAVESEAADWPADEPNVLPDATGPAMLRLLLVDDEPDVLRVLRLHLTQRGCDVVLASDGAQALAMIEAGLRVDGLITDLSMPGMDGIALIHAVHQRWPGLPAVLVTGYAEVGVGLAIDGATSGAYSLLRKPVTGSQLIDRIRDLLAGRVRAVR